MLFYRIVRWIVATGSAVVFRARDRGPGAPADVGRLRARAVAPVDDGHPARRRSSRKRRVRFMGKAALFEIPVLGSFFRALGGFPVARDGTDRKALRDSVAMLQAGDRARRVPRGHPPERARRSSRCSRAPRTSRCAPACRSCRSGSRAPRRSCATTSGPIPRFGRVAIVVGEPIVPPAADHERRAARRGRRAHRATGRRAAAGVRRRVGAARGVTPRPRRGALRLSRPRPASTSDASSARSSANGPPAARARVRIAAERERGDARRARGSARAARAAAGSTRPRR